MTFDLRKSTKNTQTGWQINGNNCSKSKKVLHFEMLPIMLQSNIYVCWLTFEEYVAECWEMMMMEEEIAQAWKKEEMEGKDEFVQNKKMDKGKGNNKL